MTTNKLLLDFASTFEMYDITIDKIVDLSHLKEDKNDLIDMLNSFDSVEHFRKTVPQISNKTEIKLYDVDYMLKVFKQFNVNGVFVEYKVPHRYNFTAKETGLEYSVMGINPYVLIGYGDNISGLIKTLEKGSKSCKEEDMFIDKVFVK